MPVLRKLLSGTWAYGRLRDQVSSRIASCEQADPHATSGAVFTVVDAGGAPPLRLFLGNTGLPRVRDVYKTRIAEWEEWAEVSNLA